MSTVKELEKTEAKAAEETFECAVQKALQVWNGFQEEKMCGKCHPCMLGSHEVLNVLDRLATGQGSERDLSQLEFISAEMLIGSRCKKGKDVAETMRKALEESRDELVEHYDQGLCRHKECKGLISYRIDVSKCTMCGECLDACKYTAIAGEKRNEYSLGYLPFRVRDNRCVRCDDCRVVCPEDAIVIVSGRDK